ncbi:MFS transporter [Sphingomonas sp. KRR8]|uniref:MFS transporter n=1 Tax=Sphingomonas sp. KRR8 TaxID=2942996 RepID=UPI0020220F07|nr:MFS transporter [Sphingomonas sp. KRR8]URD62153.1 MFS transporter [Sphingomonas sp. KRR8]
MRDAVVAHPAAEQHSDGLPLPRRYWSAAAIWLALAMAVLDGSIANVALPTIARQIGATPATSVWVVNAYQLTITMLLLPLAALGDAIGYRKVYLPGLVLFTIGSFGCAMAHGLSGLIAARVFQGVGAACIMSMNAALVRATYPTKMLGRGIGYNAMVLSASAAAGPTLAAFILEVANWPWLFLINLPIGVAAVIVGLKALPSAGGQGRRPDWVSALLSAAMMGGVVFGAEMLARTGSMSGLAMIAGGIVAGACLVRREWGDPAPLFPVDLLRNRIFGMSIATSTVSFAAQMLAYVTLPFMFQMVLGRSAFETGLLMTPWPLALGVVAPIAGRLSDKVRAGLLGGIGLAVFAAGLFSLSRLGTHPATWDIAWRMALCGAGFGLFQSPNNRTIVSAAPRERSGAAGGMLATARLLGQTTGAVAVGAAFHLSGVGAGPGLLLAASMAALVAAGLSLLRLRAPRTPHRLPEAALD